MKLLCLVLLCLCAATTAFVQGGPGLQATRAPMASLRMSASFSDKKPILVTGNNIDMTPSIKEYVEKKMNNVLSKVGGDVTKVDCHLTVDQNPRIENSHKAEITVYTKGAVVRATEQSEHMYGTIDLVSDTIFMKLRKYKEKRIDRKRGTAEARMDPVVLPEEVEDSDTEEDVYNDLDASVNMDVVKEKSFPMPPMSVEDAVVSLEYIDHDFYVFRNEKTSEVNVVYKRNSGGVGHIQPERD